MKYIQRSKRVETIKALREKPSRRSIRSVQRGSRDGFTLLKKPEKITLLDIIEIVQGPIEILDCLDSGIDCGRKRNCFARRIWSKANTEIRKVLSLITLSDA